MEYSIIIQVSGFDGTDTPVEYSWWGTEPPHYLGEVCVSVCGVLYGDI